MGMLSRGSGADDVRRRAHEERTRRESAGMPDVEEAAPPASAAEARAAREARAAGAAPTKRSARDAAAVRAARAERKPPRRRWTRGKVVALILTLLVLALATAVVVGFSWLRWFAHDDAADIQGTWYLAGTSTPIVIDGERIQLTEDVAYHYTLDSNAKTIEFTFGSLTGGGCYRFSLDRGELALVDGSFSGTDTLARDIGWTLEALIERAQGRSLAPAEEAGRGLTLLSRTPTAGASANPQSVRDTPAPGDDAADDGAAADNGTAASGDGDGDDGDDGGDGGQTIQDEPVGDLSGKIPADINDARDKAADDTAAGGTAADDSAAGGSTGTAGSAVGAGGASGSDSGSNTASAPSAADASSSGSGA